MLRPLPTLRNSVRPALSQRPQPYHFITSFAPRMAAAPSYTITLDADRYDAEQINLMEERLILLSNDDEAIGEGSKKDCALVQLPLLTPY